MARFQLDGREPDVERPGQSVLGVDGKHVAQPLTVVEEIDTALAQELGPSLEYLYLGVRFPRARTRSATDREFPQPPAHRDRRPGDAIVLETKVVVDEHRHAFAYQRTAFDAPPFPAVTGVVVQDHPRTLR